MIFGLFFPISNRPIWRRISFVRRQTSISTGRSYPNLVSMTGQCSPTSCRQIYIYAVWTDTSGRIIATSHNLTPKGSWGRKISLFQENSGWWNIILWLDTYLFCIETCSRLHLSWCTSLSLDMHVLPVSRTQLEAAQGAYHVTCCSGRAVDDITHKKLYRNSWCKDIMKVLYMYIDDTPL